MLLPSLLYGYQTSGDFMENSKLFLKPPLIKIHFSIPFVSNIRDILKVRIGEYDVTTTAEPLPHQVGLRTIAFLHCFVEYSLNTWKIDLGLVKAQSVNQPPSYLGKGIALLSIEFKITIPTIRGNTKD